MAETQTERPYALAFMRIAELAEALGVTPLNRCDPPWSYGFTDQSGSEWWLVVNAKSEPTDHPEMPNIPPFSAIVSFNDWPFGVFNPFGGQCGWGEIANEDTFTFIAALETEIALIVEAAGDRLMALVGFTAIRFSQPRNTMQTVGIPDRLYINPDRRMMVWWEAKRLGGKQSLSQAAFQSLVEGCGVDYVLGDIDALLAYLTSRGIILGVRP